MLNCTLCFYIFFSFYLTYNSVWKFKPNILFEIKIRMCWYDLRTNSNFEFSIKFFIPTICFLSITYVVRRKVIFSLMFHRRGRGRGDVYWATWSPSPMDTLTQPPKTAETSLYSIIALQPGFVLLWMFLFTTGVVNKPWWITKIAVCKENVCLRFR